MKFFCFTVSNIVEEPHPKKCNINRLGMKVTVPAKTLFQPMDPKPARQIAHCLQLKYPFLVFQKIYIESRTILIYNLYE